MAQTHCVVKANHENCCQQRHYRPNGPSIRCPNIIRPGELYVSDEYGVSYCKVCGLERLKADLAETTRMIGILEGN
jgi:hypothetical protein